MTDTGPMNQPPAGWAGVVVAVVVGALLLTFTVSLLWFLPLPSGL